MIDDQHELTQKYSNPTSSHAFVVIVEENQAIQEIDLSSFKKSRISIGRLKINDIVLSSLLASSNHGCFERFNNDWYYKDVGSLNGTFFNDKKINPGERVPSGPVKLHEYSILRIDNSSLDNPNPKGVIILFATNRVKGEWKKYDLRHKDRVVIGRDDSCDIVLADIGVSRHHAEIGILDRGYQIKDLNSKNGIILNGQVVVGTSQIFEKDTFVITTTLFIFTRGFLLYKSATSGTELKLVNVSKAVKEHGKNKVILDRISLIIEPSDFVAILGGSGAGKSTLLNVMNGFDQAVEGSVLINSIDLHKNYQMLKNSIGYVPQEDIVHNNLTLYKMLRYAAELRIPKDLTEEELNSHINSVIATLELNGHEGTLISKLSGGQRKRANIATELLADPRLFFLDEPTSGLDPGTEKKLMETLSILSKNKGKTIIMVTHTTQNLELCDKIIFMGSGGKLCFYGTINESLVFFNAKSLNDIYSMINEDSAKWALLFKSVMK